MTYNTHNNNRMQQQQYNRTMSRPTATKKPSLHYYRYDLVLNTTPAASRDEAFSTAVRRLLRKFESLEIPVALYPWERTDDKKQRIKSSQELANTNRAQLEVYFGPYWQRCQDNNLYNVSVLMGHYEEPAVMLAKISPWLLKTKQSMTLRLLQQHDTMKLGWLLYSTKYIDTKALALEIKRLTGVRVGLHWGMVSVGSTAFAKERITPVAALNIEIAVSDRELAEKCLLPLYSSEATYETFPLGIRMRFVPPLARCMSARSFAHIANLCHKQAGFLDQIQSAQSSLILNLQGRSTRLGGMSIRDLVQQIRVPDKPNTALFHSVDSAYYDPTVTIFTYMPQFKPKAWAVIGGLLVYLRSHTDKQYHAALEACFMSKAVDRSKGAMWDPRTFSAVSSADIELYELVECDKDLDFCDEQDNENNNNNIEVVPIVLAEKAPSSPKSCVSGGTTATTAESSSNNDLYISMTKSSSSSTASSSVGSRQSNNEKLLKHAIQLQHQPTVWASNTNNKTTIDDVTDHMESMSVEVPAYQPKTQFGHKNVSTGEAKPVDMSRAAPPFKLERGGSWSFSSGQWI